MTTRYLTVATFKTWLRTELTLEDAIYESAINAAELWLDEKCQRRFEVASTSTARIFNVRRASPVLYIHDCTAVASVVENGATLVVNQDYTLEPLNGLNDAGAVTPYYRLVKPYAYWYGTTNSASLNSRVTVTATWGWAAIPLSIVEACKIVAKDFFQQRDVDHGVIGVSDAGGVGTRENRLVRDAINQYSHPNSIGIA